LFPPHSLPCPSQMPSRTLLPSHLGSLPPLVIAVPFLLLISSINARQVAEAEEYRAGEDERRGATEHEDASAPQPTVSQVSGTAQVCHAGSVLPLCRLLRLSLLSDSSTVTSASWSISRPLSPQPAGQSHVYGFITKMTLPTTYWLQRSINQSVEVVDYQRSTSRHPCLCRMDGNVMETLVLTK